jgi:hypothetical protein
MTTHRELGVLPKLISLPREPIAAKWEVEENKQAGTLRALLKFSAADYEHIVRESETFDRRGNEILDAAMFDWIDEEAKHGIEATRDGSSVELVDVEPRRANLFSRAELSPYVNGKITPLADGFVLVAMYAM